MKLVFLKGPKGIRFAPLSGFRMQPGEFVIGNGTIADPEQQKRLQKAQDAIANVTFRFCSSCNNDGVYEYT